MGTSQRPSVPTTIDRLRDEFDRALHNWWSGKGELGELVSSSQWQPSVDVTETDEALEVTVDLPGIKPEDIDISVTDDRLTIQGERKQETETKDKTVHRVERSYGSFFRSIALPQGTEPDKVTAESDQGVIRITLPKADQVKPKKVSVKPK